VPGVNAVIELVNEPVPLPSIVLLLIVVGVVLEILQQTPREVTEAPPSNVILPPEIAPDVEIVVAVFVLKVGIVTVVVLKLITLP
jgi:hypothetical protein